MKRLSCLQLLLAAVTALAYAYYLPERATVAELQANPTASAAHVWICPMHPDIVQDVPGSCPICDMDLVGEHGVSTAARGPVIDTATQQRMGVRTARVRQEDLQRTLHTIGEVVLDERAVWRVAPKVEGWIDRLHVGRIGAAVVAGEPLYDLYSPALIQRQREYLELLQRRDQLLAGLRDLSGQNAQVVASLARERIRQRERFRYADFDAEHLARLERFRRVIEVVTVMAPRNGTLLELGARAGAYVGPATTVAVIADPAAAWIELELAAGEQHWVDEHIQVEIRGDDGRIVNLPDAPREASAVATGTARTRTLRVALAGAGTQLVPGTLVDVVLRSAARPALVVPRGAVMYDGHGAWVMLKHGADHFHPTPVGTGLETATATEILHGLQDGAEVAVNGQFLLDAAASLHDTVQRRRPAH